MGCHFFLIVYFLVMSNWALFLFFCHNQGARKAIYCFFPFVGTEELLDQPIPPQACYWDLITSGGFSLRAL